MDNKKVINARSHEYNGILFKSGLEVEAYKAFNHDNFDVIYYNFAGDDLKQNIIKRKSGYEKYFIDTK